MAHREVHRQTLEVLGQVGARGAVPDKAQVGVGGQALQDALQRLQILLCKGNAPICTTALAYRKGGLCRSHACMSTSVLTC